VDWSGLALDRDKCGALVNALMKFRINNMPGNYREATQQVAPRVVLSSMQLVSLVAGA
jgi:hypothetical protein